MPGLAAVQLTGAHLICYALPGMCMMMTDELSFLDLALKVLILS